MPDREKSAAAGQTSSYSAITSIPMFSKFANINSVRETTYERIILKLKDPLSKSLSDAFLKDMR